jgi:hypothetical protein
MRGQYLPSEMENVVYGDENGIEESLHRRKARSVRSNKMFDFVPGRKFRRTNLVAGYAKGKSITECA